MLTRHIEKQHLSTGMKNGGAHEQPAGTSRTARRTGVSTCEICFIDGHEPVDFTGGTRGRPRRALVVRGTCYALAGRAPTRKGSTRGQGAVRHRNGGCRPSSAPCFASSRARHPDEGCTPLCRRCRALIPEAGDNSREDTVSKRPDHREDATRSRPGSGPPRQAVLPPNPKMTSRPNFLTVDGKKPRALPQTSTPP